MYPKESLSRTSSTVPARTKPKTPKLRFAPGPQHGGSAFHPKHAQRRGEGWREREREKRKFEKPKKSFENRAFILQTAARASRALVILPATVADPSAGVPLMCTAGPPPGGTSVPGQRCTPSLPGLVLDSCRMYFPVVEKGEGGAVQLDTGTDSAMDSSALAAWVKALPRACAYLVRMLIPVGMLIPVVDLIADRADRRTRLRCLGHADSSKASVRKDLQRTSCQSSSVFGWQCGSRVTPRCG